MTQSKPDGSSQDPVTKLLDTLTPDQQEALRRKLNEKAWDKRFEQLCSGFKTPAGQRGDNKIGQKFAAALQHFIDRLSSGDIDEDIKQACRTARKPQRDDPQVLLESAYYDAQANLIQVRQGVASAIAAEKQLEQQVQKNKDQAATWQSRADMATQQGHADLCKQSMQRKEQYEKASAAQEDQLKAQRESTNQLRERFTNLQSEVQKLYTKKQLLIARDKVASATAKANEILSRTSTSGALAVMERMEKKVAEKEAHAAALSDLTEAPEPTNDTDIHAMLAKAVTSIDRLLSVVERMERKVAEDEAKAGIGRSSNDNPPL